LAVYASAVQLEGVVGDVAFLVLVDRDKDGIADVGVADGALARASSFADSYIHRWLPMPDPAPEALTDAVIWIAYYYLGGRSFTEYQLKHYEQSVKWLVDVSKGLASLGIPPSEVASASGGARISAQTRVMTRSALGRLL
jgi:phage gp36-like protein